MGDTTTYKINGLIIIIIIIIIIHELVRPKYFRATDDRPSHKGFDKKKNSW